MKHKRAGLIAVAAIFITGIRAQNVMLMAPQPPGTMAMTYEYITSEAFSGGKLVTGSPYSADESSETTQTLNDGNRITRQWSGRVYRDKDGRTRSEKTISPKGALAGNPEMGKTVMVHDPVAGVMYHLNPDSRIAEKNSINSAQSEDVRAFHKQVEKMTAEQKAMAAQAKGANVRFYSSQKTPEGKTESLGKQTIEGVEAEGIRTTVTIPAGEIGNERPIEIVSERWYSPALQAVVLTRRSDPMVGETVYKLTNISRTDPDPSLFLVPADYTVKEGINKLAGEKMHLLHKD